MVALDTRLAAILAGKDQTVYAADRIAIAGMCYDKRLYVAATRFWTDAFQAEPRLAADMTAQNRYRAACAAALAGAGKGKDEPPATEAERVPSPGASSRLAQGRLRLMEKLARVRSSGIAGAADSNPAALERRHRPRRHPQPGGTQAPCRGRAKSPDDLLGGS